MSSVQIVEISILKYLPELLAWGIGIFLAVLMLRRGGSKAEKMLLAGCSLMFAVKVISWCLGIMTPWIREQAISAQGMGIIYSLAAGLPSLAGFICLVIAFWVRFRVERQVAA